VVVGTGGYVCGPVLYAATVIGIPSLIQEQNSYPGVTTRMLAKRVDEVHLTFERSKEFLRGAKQVFVTGNPTRADLGNSLRQDALNYFGFRTNAACTTLLVFGGSLGAHTINQAMMKNLRPLMDAGMRIIWQTGKEDHGLVKNAAQDFPKESLWVNAFIDRMDFAYAASDLVICRAGATTIAELTRLGKPAILIPYPHAAANHQVENAKSVVEAGAAILIYDHEADTKLEPAVRQLLDGNRLKEMSEKSKSLGRPDAANDIAERIISLGGR